MSANRPVRLCSSKREVTRTSVRDGEAANGCTASSRRQAELSKPIDCTISSPISRWAAIGKLPAKTSWRAGFIAICDSSGTSPSRRRSKSAATCAVVVPGSKRSSSAS